jgi:hypothetical protein
MCWCQLPGEFRAKRHRNVIERGVRLQQRAQVTAVDSAREMPKAAIASSSSAITSGSDGGKAVDANHLPGWLNARRPATGRGRHVRAGS